MAGNLDENDSIRRKPGIAMNLTYTGVPTIDYDNGRDEKPWQRVPSSLIVLVLAWYLLLGYLTQLVEEGMPRVINEADLARDNTDTFSEETSWRYLHNILGNEPRVGGTAYHYNKTIDMKTMVDNIASQANQHVHTDWQMVSGDYFIQSQAPFVNLYANVSNIIAVLEGESGFHSNGTIRTSVLVNCHYDSVPFAMGASDNAVFCAVMMEILNKMSRRTRKFKNNIVFLFNGGEEIGLLGSHGFLQHPWAQGVTAVVNLDAAGMNGKPSVFQVSDPRLLRAYQRASGRPSAQSLGEFLFSTGIIPSDTDFRIFRDFGDINGIDIAFTKWGHVYHTRYDHPDLIKPGVIQNAGNMLLALLTDLGDMDELNVKEENPSSPAVYYDFLNAFMVTYSMPAAYAIDVAICLFAALSISYYIWLVGPRMSTVKELLLIVVSRLAALLAGVAMVFIPASIMIATTVQLRYLSEAWIVVPMFWIPYLIGSVAASEAFDAWRTKKSGLNRSIRALQAMSATRLITMLVLLVMVCVRRMQSARYLLSVPLFMMSLASFLSITVIRYWRLQAWQHLLLEVVVSTPCMLFLFMLALRLDSMILPIMGRTPSDWPDYIIACINIGLAALTAIPVSGIELLFSRRRLWLPLGVLYAACVVIMFVPFSPFRDEGPATQRHYWFHTEISSSDINQQQTEYRTGVSVLKLDAYSAATVVARMPRTAQSVPAQACADRVYCDLPLYRTSYGKYLDKAVFLYMEGPAAFTPRASLTANRTCLGETCTYSFLMNGAPHNTITIWPRPGVNVTMWSLQAPVRASFHQRARPVYSVAHTLATSRRPAAVQHFNITCTVPLSMQSQTAVEVSHHSHKIYHPEDFTQEYSNLLNSMPKYFNVASFLSFRHNYEF